MAGVAAPEILAQVIDCYLEDTPQLLQAIAVAVDRGDAIALRRAAHTLKSTSATLGATDLAQLCKELEVMGQTKAIDNAQVLVSQIEIEYAKVQIALQMERQHA